MITRKENESRLAYLVRVAIHHIRDHASDCLTDYDETDCDGSCLADELERQLEELNEHEERQRRIAEAIGYGKPCTKEEHAKPLKQPEVVPLGLCPKCRRHLDSEPDHAARGERVTCRVCNIHATGDNFKESCTRLRAAFSPAPAPPPCLCLSGFTIGCPVHATSIAAAEELRLECGPNCHHTPEEHQAFDIGVDTGERDPNAENPCRKFSNPREDLIEAWEAGYSVGCKNREAGPVKLFGAAYVLCTCTGGGTPDGQVIPSPACPIHGDTSSQPKA